MNGGYYALDETTCQEILGLHRNVCKAARFSFGKRNGNLRQENSLPANRIIISLEIMSPAWHQ